jgi:hypothetical protein
VIDFNQLDGGVLEARVRGVRDLDTTVAYWEAILDRVAREPAR